MKMTSIALLIAVGSSFNASAAEAQQPFGTTSDKLAKEKAAMSTEGVSGEPLTVDEIEAAHLYADDGRIPHVPFGFANENWQRFKAEMKPGDRIYAFCSDSESWAALAGRSGYVLVRDGKQVAEIVTILN